MEELTPETWRRLLRRPPACADVPLYGPLLAADAFALGRLAQSLDGYIALPDGRSQWISGPEDIAHTHRVRALSDAVVVGAGTVRADDPQLTTRLCEGPSPVRVVLDPGLSLSPTHRVFDGTVPTLVVAAETAPATARIGAAEVLRIPGTRNALDLAALRAALRARGLRRLFVEGGGKTVARVLAAGVLDRLHVTVAPMLMGGGIPAFPLPPIDSLGEAPRYAWAVHPIGRDILLDIALGPG